MLDMLVLPLGVYLPLGVRQSSSLFGFTPERSLGVLSIAKGDFFSFLGPLLVGVLLLILLIKEPLFSLFSRSNLLPLQLLVTSKPKDFLSKTWSFSSRWLNASSQPTRSS